VPSRHQLSLAGAVAGVILIGTAAGLLPTIRAARLSPAQALWTL
jgi:ABC-type antimicrobial peptide transport system permease subunit